MPIIYEDDALLIINKPAGVVVNRAETQKVETLEAWLAEDKGIKAERSGIVHRLDKDTSGLLVVAKNDGVMTALQEQFANRTIEKEYIALCHEYFSEKTGTITTSIGRNPYNRHKFMIQSNGRTSETHWLVEKTYALDQLTLEQLLPALNKNQQRYYKQQAIRYTFVRLFPKTGRTHQLRVHLASLRHPIVSDTLYGSRKLVRLDVLWCPRQFLHATKLVFTHPVSRKRMVFEAELPQDLKDALSLLN